MFNLFSTSVDRAACAMIYFHHTGGFVVRLVYMIAGAAPPADKQVSTDSYVNTFLGWLYDSYVHLKVLGNHYR